MEKRKRSSSHISRLPMFCHVCGDVARGLNFCVLTCMSCKTFFRRNAYRRMNLQQCESNNTCSITKETRTYCPACRLEKCFTVGMDPLTIRSIPTYPLDSRKKTPKPKMIKEKTLQLSMPLTLDLLQKDRSTLTSEQWTLISNIVHVYDKQHCIVQIKSLVNQMCSLPPKLRSKSSSISDIITDILGEAFGGVQTIIEYSSDLRSLPADAHRALIKYNMYTTGGLNTLFLFRELDLYNNLAVVDALTALYGYDVTTTSARNSNECDPNGNLIKIFIFVLVFSDNCSIVTFNDQEDIRSMSTSTYRIKIQNVYMTAFWKYLVYLYGFEEAVIRFSSLVKRILNLLYIAELILNNVTHNQIIDTLVTETERSLIIKTKE